MIRILQKNSTFSNLEKIQGIFEEKKTFNFHLEKTNFVRCEKSLYSVATYGKCATIYRKNLFTFRNVNELRLVKRERN